MRILALAAICTFLLSSCATSPAALTTDDERFQAHAARVLEEMWQEFPESATRYGNYKYVDRMSVPTQAPR